MNAIILHGKPGKDEYYDVNVASASNAHWLPWLQKQLLINNVPAHTPEIPNAWKPDYVTWKKEFERYDINEETILVGHSCGGGFIIRWLSEHPSIKVNRVVLVAPWLDPDRCDTTDFFEFRIDSRLAERTKGLTIFDSDDDDSSIHQSIAMIRAAVGDVNYRQFQRYGHFCYDDMHTLEFPELLQELLS